MTLPGRSVLIPTKREVALMLFSLAGGVWLWATFIDWLNTRHRELAADVERTRPQAVMSAAANVAMDRAWARRMYGKKWGKA